LGTFSAFDEGETDADFIIEEIIIKHLKKTEVVRGIISKMSAKFTEVHPDGVFTVSLVAIDG
jgi:fructose-1,6-bisphosphatase